MTNARCCFRSSSYVYDTVRRLGDRHAAAWTVTAISSPERLTALRVPFLDRMAQRIVSTTELSEAHVRLLIQSAVFLVGRYASLSDDELRALAGIPDGDPHPLIAEHLGGVFASVLGW